MKTYDILDIAWLAGFLEGEGSFTKTGPSSIGITVGSVDKDVIFRVKNIIGHGKISLSRTTLTGKQFYFYYLNRRVHVENVLHNILPFMGKRRAEKIEKLLFE